MIKRLIDALKAHFIYDEMDDVKRFQLKFGQIVNDKPVHLTKRKLGERAEFLQEELDEFKRAIESQDLAEQADALIDLVYVAKGTANMLGLPWEDLWLDVQRANMAKVAGVGKRGHLVDCIKPPGWVGPQTLVILHNAGYDAVEFHCPVQQVVLEEKCHDDAVHLA